MSTLAHPRPVRRIWRLLPVAALVLALAGFMVVFFSRPVPRAHAGSLSPSVRIDAIMAGANGASKVQYIEIETENAGQKCWGPQITGTICFTGVTETTGRDMLVFYDANGNQTGRYVFPHDPGGTANTVLVATPAFAALPGAPAPDFHPAEVIAGDRPGVLARQPRQPQRHRRQPVPGLRRLPRAAAEQRRSPATRWPGPSPGRPMARPTPI